MSAALPESSAGCCATTCSAAGALRELFQLGAGCRSVGLCLVGPPARVGRSLLGAFRLLLLFVRAALEPLDSRLQLLQLLFAAPPRCLVRLAPLRRRRRELRRGGEARRADLAGEPSGRELRGRIRIDGGAAQRGGD